jgi:hypothetical protein|tara:strand:- start:85837 stop:86121 length:285 start_codon:yes stop_codon:yes gene_type:complete
MNSESIDITQHRLNNASKKTNLFVEMKDLGIDPIPLLEIAAHDLLNQYGNDAVTFSMQIERDFEDDGDFQSAEIWQKISHYLQNLNGPGELIAH